MGCAWHRDSQRKRRMKYRQHRSLRGHHLGMGDTRGLLHRFGVKIEIEKVITVIHVFGEVIEYVQDRNL